MSLQIPPPIIKPPKSFTKPATAEGVQRNLAWLKSHHQEYQGQWIVLNEGILLGANPSFVELRRGLKQTDQLREALFFSLK